MCFYVLIDMYIFMLRHFLSFQFLSVWYMYTCVCGRWTYVSMHLCRGQVDIGYLLLLFSTLVFETASLLNLKLTDC